LKAARLLLVGAGKREQFNAPRFEKFAGAALRYLKRSLLKNLAFLVRESDATGENAQAIVEGCDCCQFRTDNTRRIKERQKSKPFRSRLFRAERAAGEKESFERPRSSPNAQNLRVTSSTSFTLQAAISPQKCEGTLTRSRVKFCRVGDDAAFRKDLSLRQRAPRRNSRDRNGFDVLSFFLSVLYLSGSKLAAIAPSTIACAFSPVASLTTNEEFQGLDGATF